MSTGLTFHGQYVDVVLADRTLELADPTSGGDPVVLLRSEITDVELKRPTLLGYGRLVISTRGGDQHTVEFAKDAQESFDNLAAIIRP